MRVAGLAVVRWTFNFINKQEGKTIVEVVKYLKEAKDDLKK